MADLKSIFKSAIFRGKNLRMISNPVLISVKEGVSLFDFVNKYCFGEKSGLSHNAAFHRLCSLMRKMKVKSAIVEEVSPQYSEIIEECQALNARFNKKIKIMAYRITFLQKEVFDLQEVEALSDNDFLSSTIIINFQEPNKGWKSYVFYSIMTLPKMELSKDVLGTDKDVMLPLLNNYFHVYKSFQREVVISESRTVNYTITGTYFCQQNSLTSVCAHAALCMILNNMKNMIQLIHPENINKIIEVDHDSIKFGDDGKATFTDKEIRRVLKGHSLASELLDCFDAPNIEYNDYIYKYLESGCPVLLVFKTSFDVSHVVPILGHTLNTDMWRPEAEVAYSPSSQLEAYRINLKKSASAWVDHFIIHDDNFGMYFCLPVDALKRVTLPKHDPTFRAHYAVVIKPAEVLTPPREAEDASMIVTLDILEWRLNTGNPLDTWTKRVLNRVFNGRQVTVRTFLTSKDAYSNSLNEKDFTGNEFSEKDKEELLRKLPKTFWLSEITLPELYTANKKKLIDFFYSCEDAPDKDKINERWIQIRFPLVLVRRDEKGAPEIYPMSVCSHYPLLIHDREFDTLDW